MRFPQIKVCNIREKNATIYGILKYNTSSNILPRKTSLKLSEHTINHWYCALKPNKV